MLWYVVIWLLMDRTWSYVSVLLLLRLIEVDLMYGQVVHRLLYRQYNAIMLERV